MDLLHDILVVGRKKWKKSTKQTWKTPSWERKMQKERRWNKQPTGEVEHQDNVTVEVKEEQTAVAVGVELAFAFSLFGVAF